MPEENMQPYMENEMPIDDGMSNDDLAAALGFITTLGEQNLMAQQPQEMPEEAPQEEEPAEEPQEEPTEEPVEGGLLSEIQAIRAELEQQDVSKEVAEIRAELEKLLEEEKDDGKEAENKDAAE